MYRIGFINKLECCICGWFSGNHFGILQVQNAPFQESFFGTIESKHIRNKAKLSFLQYCQPGFLTNKIFRRSRRRA
jgi:hypothetical protein